MTKMLQGCKTGLVSKTKMQTNLFCNVKAALTIDWFFVFDNQCLRLENRFELNAIGIYTVL